MSMTSFYITEETHNDVKFSSNGKWWEAFPHVHFFSRGNVMENVNVWMSEFSDLGQEVEKIKSVLMKWICLKGF